MGKWDELRYLDATAQAELIRKGEVKAIELVDAAIERVERLNPKLNAVVTPMYEQGRQVAKGPLPDGPFTGVPFLLKDLIAEYAGVRLTEGSAFLKDFVPDHDSELVVRLKRAGLIIIGKTNTPEFGTLPTTEPRLFGPTRNPWDPSRMPGGSSGGSAAAVAAGMVPMAHGNDAGGSIRIPSSCCGVFGLKPTRGRNPLGPLYGDLLSGLVAEHAITRSVRDSAALLDATSGPDLGDPYWAPPPARPFIQEVGASPGRLRIAYTTKAATEVPVHEDCVQAVQEAAKLCSALGHEVVEAEWAIDGKKVARGFTTLFCVMAAFVFDHWERRIGKKITREIVEPLNWALQEKGRQQSPSAYLLALEDLQKVSREVARLFLHHDVWLTPTLAEPPVPLGTFDSTPDNPLQGWYRSGKLMPFTSIWNVTGQPAMSVPLHWNQANLPIGVQFIGRFGDEATLFRLAAQLEQAKPWAKQRPPLSG